MSRQRPVTAVLHETGPLSARRPRVRVSLLLRRDGATYLLRSHLAGRPVWFLPGGALDWGETLAEAAIREAREELGIGITLDGLAGVVDGVSPREPYHHVEIIFAARTTDEPSPLGEDDDDAISDDRHAEAGAWFRGADLATIEAYPPRFLAEVAPALLGGAALPDSYLGNDWE
jgi:8-oxo-dGTP diphosphatase